MAELTKVNLLLVIMKWDERDASRKSITGLLLSTERDMALKDWTTVEDGDFRALQQVSVEVCTCCPTDEL